MPDIFNNLILWAEMGIMRIMDPLLGWLLHLHRDVVVALVASATALAMVMVRKRTTDQEWLGRAARDQERLDELIKEAKCAKDKAAIARYKTTKNTIQLRALKFEGKPLLIVIVPVMLVLTWCFGRLGFEPPRAGEPVRVKLTVDKSEIGALAHLAPLAGLEAGEGWVRKVERDRIAPLTCAWDRGNAWLVCHVTRLFSKALRMPQADPEALLEGAAVWEVAGQARPEPYPLQVVVNGATYRADLLVGQPRYAAAQTLFTGGKVQSIGLLMRPYRPFGFIGALDWLFCPPWLVAYLLIAMPLFFLFKRIFNVH